MEYLSEKIESLLLTSSKPVPYRRLARVLEASESEVADAVLTLARERNASLSGIHVLVHNGAAELVTNPLYSDVVSAFVEREDEGILTRPALETLTIVAYRGPVSKPDIEAIRGVNCALILRNLLMRGLIVEREENGLSPLFVLSHDTLRFFGVRSVHELPDYATLRDAAVPATSLV